MSNFGVLQLRVVNPYDVAFREARSAMGGGSVAGEGRGVQERGRGRG